MKLLWTNIYFVVFFLQHKYTRTPYKCKNLYMIHDGINIIHVLQSHPCSRFSKGLMFSKDLLISWWNVIKCGPGTPCYLNIASSKAGCSFSEGFLMRWPTKVSSWKNRRRRNKLGAAAPTQGGDGMEGRGRGFLGWWELLFVWNPGSNIARRDKICQTWWISFGKDVLRASVWFTDSGWRYLSCTNRRSHPPPPHAIPSPVLPWFRAQQA